MIPDLINGLFELGGAAAVGLSIRRVLKDKDVAGVSAWQVAFFQTWGLWNIIFYPAIGQVWSTIGAVFLALANTIYLYYLFKYRRRPKNECRENLPFG
jgi:predicted membrane-bound mannosyltransferase